MDARGDIPCIPSRRRRVVVRSIVGIRIYTRVWSIPEISSYRILPSSRSATSALASIQVSFRTSPPLFFAALNLLRARSATIHITDLNCARVQNWTDVKRCARAPVRRYRSSAHTYSNRARSRNRQSSSFHARSGKLQI